MNYSQSASAAKRKEKIVEDLSALALKVDSDVQQQAHGINMPGLSLI